MGEVAMPESQKSNGHFFETKEACVAWSSSATPVRPDIYLLTAAIMCEVTTLTDRAIDLHN